MPLMLELRYEYFPSTWPGRIKLAELIFALLCLMCGAPAYNDTQHWFLLVVTVALLGTIFFCLYHLCLSEPLNKIPFVQSWLTVEFWFTAITTFFYFTAFVAQLAEFGSMDISDEAPQYWVDAQLAAGTFALFNFLVYAAGAYFIYADWKPAVATATVPPV